MNDAQKLRQWSKDNARWISLEDGQTVIARLKRFEAMKTIAFGEEKDVVRYYLELANGQEKTWDQQSASTANKVAEILDKNPKPILKISRTGAGNQTRYDITEYTGEFTPEKCPF